MSEINLFYRKVSVTVGHGNLKHVIIYTVITYFCAAWEQTLTSAQVSYKNKFIGDSWEYANKIKQYCDILSELIRSSNRMKFYSVNSSK